MIKLEAIKKTYYTGKVKTVVLKGINLTIAKGEFIMILGKSGCGKSTLLNILGGIDNASSGIYYFQVEDTLHEKSLIVSELKGSALAAFRNQYISFIFQAFHLIPEINVIDNVALPLGYRGVSKKKRYALAQQALQKVRLIDMEKKRPNTLSGGEQQRVAIARALVSGNKLILADEPTGNLDEKNSIEIMKTLKKINQQGTTVVMVTHDIDLTTYASRVIHIEDGVIVE